MRDLRLYTVLFSLPVNRRILTSSLDSAVCAHGIPENGDAVEPALRNDSLSQQLTLPNGRLESQRNITWNALNNIPGITCVKPGGAFYLFPRLDPKFYNIDNDEDLILDVLSSEKILLVQGSAFNIPDNHHFRIVFLPSADQLSDALVRIGGVLEKYHSL